MYLLFGILCFIFLAFNLEVIDGRPRHHRYALIWRWKDFTLIRIFPQNIFVLVDHDIVYRYIEASKETYIHAVRLDTYLVNTILNYRYILEWMTDPPLVKQYSPELSDEIEILNFLSQSLTP